MNNCINLTGRLVEDPEIKKMITEIKAENLGQNGKLRG